MDKEKTWMIIVERPSGQTDTYFIKAQTLYDAFKKFSEAFFPWNMVGLHIAEVKHNETEKRKEERPSAGILGAYQMAGCDD